MRPPTFIVLALLALPALAQPTRKEPAVPPERKFETPERLTDAPTPRRPEKAPPPPKFIIGVFQQPSNSFESWKSRGVNTLVGFESQGNRVSNKEWSDAAAARGLYFIRQPSADLAADAAEPYLLAFSHDDEPDIQRPPTMPTTLAAKYATWKKAAPDKPVFLNLSGGQLLGGRTARSVYDAYLPSADWIGSDIYPVTGYNRPDWLWKVGAAVDTLREWSAGKPQFAFIETSAQELSWTPAQTRGATSEEFRAMVIHAVIHGVRGVVYFPQRLGRNPAKEFRYDATPPRVAMEMTTWSHRLAEIQDALVTAPNPPTHPLQAAKPLEIGWRVHDGALYVIALNFADAPLKSAAIKLPTSGGTPAELWQAAAPAAADNTITTDFDSYGVRVYRIPIK